MTDAVVMQNVSKRYGATVALDSVDFRVSAGEVHGLVGLNGSGKSTLMKVLGGAVSPEPGAECLLWGEPAHLPLHNPVAHGITIVPQTLGLSPGLTVLDNVNAGGALTGRGLSGLRVRRRRAAKRLTVMLADLGWTLNPFAEVGELTPGEQAIVAITRAFATARSGAATAGTERPLCIILDEPTAYLTTGDTDRLLAALGQLVAEGNSAILVSHRLGDLYAACRRVTILREGRVAGHEELATTSRDRLVDLMTGGIEAEVVAGRSVSAADKAVIATADPRPAVGTEVAARGSATGSTARRAGTRASGALELRALTTGHLHGIDLRVGRGEVVACTGIIGSGVEQLGYAVIGQLSYTGQVFYDAELVPARPHAARRRGILLVPADRSAEAGWQLGTLADNLAPMTTQSAFKGAFVSRSRTRAEVDGLLREYEVVARGPANKLSELSGGNQQKLIIGRALSDPRLKTLILHEPTSGVDVHARAAIHQMIRAKAAEGTPVLVCSSDIEEVVQISDRIVVLRGGRITQELAPNVTPSAVALACN